MMASCVRENGKGTTWTWISLKILTFGKIQIMPVSTTGACLIQRLALGLEESVWAQEARELAVTLKGGSRSWRRARVTQHAGVCGFVRGEHVRPRSSLGFTRRESRAEGRRRRSRERTGRSGRNRQHHAGEARLGTSRLLYLTALFLRFPAACADTLSTYQACVSTGPRWWRRGRCVSRMRTGTPPPTLWRLSVMSPRSQLSSLTLTNLQEEAVSDTGLTRRIISVQTHDSL